MDAFETCPKCKTIKDVYRGQKCACESEFPEHMKDHPYILERESKARNEVVLRLLDHMDR